VLPHGLRVVEVSGLHDDHRVAINLNGLPDDLVFTGDIWVAQPLRDFIESDYLFKYPAVQLNEPAWVATAAPGEIRDACHNPDAFRSEPPKSTPPVDLFERERRSVQDDWLSHDTLVLRATFFRLGAALLWAIWDADL
jgi:hypothetical protein